MKIGFYLKELNFRGIANSIYLFAKNNQKILKNKSFIFYNKNASDNENEAIMKFKKEFKTFEVKNFNDLEKLNNIVKLDYIYFQRDGAKEKLLNGTKNIIHAIFPQNLFQIHGSSYAYISSWLSKTCSNNKIPFVPLPVKLMESKKKSKK